MTRWIIFPQFLQDLKRFTLQSYHQTSNRDTSNDNPHFPQVFLKLLTFFTWLWWCGLEVVHSSWTQDWSLPESLRIFCSWMWHTSFCRQCSRCPLVLNHMASSRLCCWSCSLHIRFFRFQVFRLNLIVQFIICWIVKNSLISSQLKFFSPLSYLTNNIWLAHSMWRLKFSVISRW